MKQRTHALLLVSCILAISLHAVTSSMADEPATPVADEPVSSVDELIVNAANSSQEFEFFYDENSRFLKVEYDMVFSYEEYAEIERLNGVNESSASSPGGRAKRTAGIINGRGGGRRWSNNVVPYQFASVFSSRDQGQMNAAIADWERYTCLDFQQRSSGNRIYFNNGGGCYSRVGMVGGAQTLGLAPGCRTKGVVIHEIGHALGLHHEQTRPDRDEHVRIIRQNIPSRVFYNFQKNTWNVILNMGIPYDYTSIMHYGKTAFSQNGGLTIQTVNPKYQNVIGNRHGLSFRDIKSVNIMYNCKRHTRSCTKTDANCPGEGFVGKDCQCWCPGGSLRNPTKSCSGTTTTGGGSRTTMAPPVTRRPTPRPTGCTDRHRSCTFWAGRRECRKNPGYMNIYCKRSCNQCGNGGTQNCRDQQYNCPMWKRFGYCNGRWRNYMNINCKSSCGKCGQRSDVCVDDNDLCPDWATRGECQRNPAYMLVSCKLSCHQCNAASPEGFQATPRNCRDRNEHCSFWAAGGACENNRGYMAFNCRFSCDMCPAAQV